jgi:nitrile hydratase
MRQPSKTSLFAAAKNWDEASVAAALARAPELIHASDPKGRTALHFACAAKPDNTGSADAHGLRTVATLLACGADLEAEVPMDEDEGDFRATCGTACRDLPSFARRSALRGVMTMSDQNFAFRRTASVEQRVDAIQALLDEHGLQASEGVAELDHLAVDQWVPQNGARVVAKAWVDPAFRQRLLADGRAAIAELGLPMPKHHRHLVVLENTPAIQNVICCTLCSCTAFTIIGLPPDWYKDLEYRARVVRESRTVLREMGLDLPPEVEIRVWDTTADTRYMVLPEQPPATIGWPEEKLAGIVTRDSMIGVARL